MRCGFVTGAGAVAVRVHTCGALACVAYASVNWQTREKSLALSNQVGSWVASQGMVKIWNRPPEHEVLRLSKIRTTPGSYKAGEANL
jgi:hypothetical protein